MGARDALIVIPTDGARNFLAHRSGLAAAFTGTVDRLDVYVPHGPFIGLALEIWGADSLQLDSVTSLADVVSRAHVVDCTLDVWVLSCALPIKARAQVDDGRVAIWVTDRAWVRRLIEAQPETGWLRAFGADRQERWARLVPIRYLAAAPRRRDEPAPNAPQRAAVPPWQQTIATNCRGLLALGDTLRCRPFRQGCAGDVCFAEALARGADTTSITWLSTDESVIRVSDGLLHAVGRGHAQIQVSRGDTVGTSDFDVIGPVQTIRFERPVYELRIGDTVRIRAWAYDSAGHRVQSLLPGGYSAGKGYPIRPGASWDLVKAIAIGRSVASVSLAHRRDTAVIVVRP